MLSKGPNFENPNIHGILISISLPIFIRFVFVFRSGELVAYISGMPSSAEIIRAMDEISNTVRSHSLSNSLFLRVVGLILCYTLQLHRSVLSLTPRSFVDKLILTGYYSLNFFDFFYCCSFLCFGISLSIFTWLCIREFVEEAIKASIRVNEYLHVRWRWIVFASVINFLLTVLLCI